MNLIDGRGSTQVVRETIKEWYSSPKPTRMDKILVLLQVELPATKLWAIVFTFLKKIGNR